MWMNWKCVHVTTGRGVCVCTGKLEMCGCDNWKVCVCVLENWSVQVCFSA